LRVTATVVRASKFPDDQGETLNPEMLSSSIGQYEHQM